MPGLVTLSIEVELGWGMHDRKIFNHLSSDREAETAALGRLLNRCGELEIPVTFDIVGHLFDTSCRGTHHGAYPDGWWRMDPGSDVANAPLFYAPEFVDAIRDSDSSHEIATHTYSHILADECPPSLLSQELDKVADRHESAGLEPPTSIVLPRHRTTPYEPLREHGISTIRRPVSDYGCPYPTRAGKLYWYLTRSHPTTSLERSEGILETPCTPHPSLTHKLLPQGQRPVPHAAFRVFPRSVRQRLHRYYLRDAIDSAAAAGEHVHLWTHLYNFANKAQWPGIDAGLGHLATRRDEGAVTIATMADLSNHLEDPA